MGTAVTEVRALLDEASPAMWTDAQIMSWLNQGCADIARRAEILWDEANITVTANVQTYPFPADFLTAHRCEFTINPPIWSPGSLPRSWSSGDQLHGRELGDDPFAARRLAPLVHHPGQSGGQLPVHDVPGPGRRRGGHRLLLPPGPARHPPHRERRHAVGLGGHRLRLRRLQGAAAAYLAIWKDVPSIYETQLANMINKTRNMTDQMNQVTSGIGNLPVYAYSDGWDGI